MLSKSSPSVQALFQWHAIASSLVNVAHWSLWINLIPLIPIRMVLPSNVSILKLLKKNHLLKYISRYLLPTQIPLNKKEKGIPREYLKHQFGQILCLV